MKGLTAKVFRTFNASITFQRLLDENGLENATLQEKLNAYNKANRLVAILCNHQRSAPKTHDQSMEKMRFRVCLLFVVSCVDNLSSIKVSSMTV